MFKTISIASCLLFIVLAQSPCPTPQYAAQINDVSNFTPVQAILSAVLEQEKLDNIITVQSNYLVQDIQLKPELFDEDISVTLLDKQLTILVSVPYIVDFQITQDTAIIGDGSGFLTSSSLTIVAQTTDYQSWILTVIIIYLFIHLFYKSVTGDYSAVQFMELNFSTLLTTDQYNELEAALTTGDNSIPKQLATLYGSEQYTSSLQTSINSWMDKFLDESYSYTYMNINRVEQTVTLVSKQSKFEFDSSSSFLSIERNMAVNGFPAQACGTLTPPTVKGTQIEEYTWESLQSVFNYAQSQKYFDTVLGSTWNSPYFQFDAASLWNVLNGIQGNFYPYNQATGSCTTSSATLTNNDGVIQTQLQVSCQIDQIQSSSTEPLITVDFDLSLNVKVSQNDYNEFEFIGQSPQLSNIGFIENPSYTLSDPQLAELYLKTVVINAFNNQQLFGSGFPTLSRSQSQTAWEGTNIVIYEEQQEE